MTAFNPDGEPTRAESVHRDSPAVWQRIERRHRLCWLATFAGVALILVLLVWSVYRLGGEW